MKKSFLFALLVFSMSLAYSQHQHYLEKMDPSNHPFGKIIELKLNKAVDFPDSLSVKLNSFSHKRAMTGGPTKATAYLMINREGMTDTIQLSVHGVENKPAQFDKYDTLQWKSYEFRLMKFSYDESIELIITKK